jgi:TrmH family RNA methyltransferase
MGTIIRIADWFGLQQIVASDDSADCYNPKTIQATMGSIFRVNVRYKNLEDFLSSYSKKIYGALLQGKDIRHQPAVSEGVLVIGNESKGIRENIKPYIHEALAIPAFGKAESLNAAVATGIILSHLIK